jgi:hypothetical protein
MDDMKARKLGATGSPPDCVAIARGGYRSLNFAPGSG